MERWRGKSALVTGASAGIGYAITEALARNGMRIIACSRVTDNIQNLKSKLPQGGNDITAIPCDLTKEEDILRMFKEIESTFGHVDVVVNNAGSAQVASVTTGETVKWRHMLDLNLLAMSIVTREALRLMEKNGVDDGHIVNINSTCGHSLDIDADLLFYAGTKHMVTALTKALNSELRQKKSKIRVTSVSPGQTDTRLQEDLRNSKEKFNVPYEFPVLQGEDVANAVLYALGCPSHVNIRELVIAPTEQVKA